MWAGGLRVQIHRYTESFRHAKRCRRKTLPRPSCSTVLRQVRSRCPEPRAPLTDPRSGRLSAAGTFWADADRHLIRYAGAGPLTREIIDHAAGSFLFTEDGRQILDFTSSQMNAILGHCHPEIVATVTRRRGPISTTSSEACSAAPIWWKPPRGRTTSAMRATLTVTGLRALDGARCLRDAQHADTMLCRLVAHHSCAIIEAGGRGLTDVLGLELAPASQRFPAC